MYDFKVLLKFMTRSMHMYHLFFRTFAFFAPPYVQGSCCMYLVLGCAVKKSD